MLKAIPKEITATMSWTLDTYMSLLDNFWVSGRLLVNAGSGGSEDGIVVLLTAG